MAKTPPPIPFVYPPSVPEKWRKLHRVGWAETVRRRSDFLPVEVLLLWDRYPWEGRQETFEFVNAPGGITPLFRTQLLWATRLTATSPADEEPPALATLARDYLAPRVGDDVACVERVDDAPEELVRQVEPGALSGLLCIRDDRCGEELLRMCRIFLSLVRETRLVDRADPRRSTIEWAITGNHGYVAGHPDGEMLFALSPKPQSVRRTWDISIVGRSSAQSWRAILSTHGFEITSTREVDAADRATNAP
jgi:hypothetical protein